MLAIAVIFVVLSGFVSLPIAGQNLLLRSFDETNSVTSVAANDEYLFTGTGDAIITQWFLSNGSSMRQYLRHYSFVNSLALTASFLFSGSGDSTVKKWSLQNGSCLWTFEGHQVPVWSIALLETGDPLSSFGFSGGSDVVIKQWSLANGSWVRDFSGSTEYMSIRVAPDYTTSLQSSQYLMYSGSLDTKVKQWSLQNGSCIRIFSGHVNQVYSIALSAEYLFSGSIDSTLKQWSLGNGSYIRDFTGHSGQITAVEYAGGALGQYLFGAMSNGRVCQWSISTGTLLWSSSGGHTNYVWTLAINQRSVFSGSSDKTAKQWSIYVPPVSTTTTTTTTTVGSSFTSLLDPSSSILRLDSTSISTLSTAISSFDYFAGHTTTKSSVSSDFISSSGSSSRQAASTTVLPTSPAHVDDDNKSATVNSGNSEISLVNLIVIVSSTTATIFVILTTVVYLMQKRAGKRDKRKRRGLSDSLTNPFSVTTTNFYSTQFDATRPQSPTEDSNISSSSSSSGSTRPISFPTFQFPWNGSSSGVMLTTNATKKNMEHQQHPDSYDQHHHHYQLQQQQSLEIISTVLFGTTLYSPTDSTSVLALPGDLLINKPEAEIAQSIRMLYKNKRTVVYVANALDSDLKIRARHNPVAVKRITTVNVNTLPAFHQEVAIMALFRGRKNFVQLLGFSNYPCLIITEYYPLGSLDRFLYRQRTSVSTRSLILRFANQICSAVAIMHQSNYSHSDLKPQNIFIDKQDQHDGGGRGQFNCRLGDFGLARVLDKKKLSVKAYQVQNIDGMTVNYAAPEIFQTLRGRGGDDDLEQHQFDSGMFFKKSDLYSLGVIMWELLVSNLAELKMFKGNE